MQHSLLTIMYEFLGLQHTHQEAKTSSEREEKHNNYYRNVCERAFRKAWNEEAMVKIH